MEDCAAQRQFNATQSDAFSLKPLLMPTDDKAFDVITRIGSGDYYADYHTTANIGVYDEWVARLNLGKMLPP